MVSTVLHTHLIKKPSGQHKLPGCVYSLFLTGTEDGWKNGPYPSRSCRMGSCRGGKGWQ